MGNWTPDPTHRGWQVFVPDHADDWPPDRDMPERCRCWAQGCVLTRHRVPQDGAPQDPEAPDTRPWRPEIFHARPIPAPKPARPERHDGRARAAGER